MLSVLRIVSGLVFITFGTMKLFNYPPMPQGMPPIPPMSQGHYAQSFWPSVNMGTPAILYCFVFLYFVFAGAGPWGIDAMIARSKGGNPY